MVKRRVYILSRKSYHSYKTAEQFGELITVYNGTIPIFKLDKTIEILRTSLQDFTEQDLLLLSGTPLLSIISCSYLMEKFGKVNVLMYNVFDQSFTIRTLWKNQLFNLGDQNEKEINKSEAVKQE